MSDDNPRCPKCEHRVAWCICATPPPVAVEAIDPAATRALPDRLREVLMWLGTVDLSDRQQGRRLIALRKIEEAAVALTALLDRIQRVQECCARIAEAMHMDVTIGSTKADAAFCDGYEEASADIARKRSE